MTVGKRGPKPRSVKERLLAQTKVQEDGCWLWLGYVNPDGYGRIKVGRTNENAHRVAYRELVGDFPAELHIDHLCRNRRCVNPDHLEPVTIAENLRRGPGSITHCKQGHERTPENLQVRADGRKVCKLCHREQALASYYRRSAGGGTRTRTSLRSADLESAVSPVPPRRHEEHTP